MFNVVEVDYVCVMNEKNENPDDVEPGLSEGDVHSGPGGYEGMGYAGGYAADYFNKDKDEDEKDGDEKDGDDFDEDEANRF